MKHCFTLSTLFTPHRLLFLLLLLALTLQPQAPKAQDTLAFYRFENNLFPEPGFPVQDTLEFSVASAYYTPAGYEGSAFIFLFGGNHLVSNLHTINYENVYISVRIKNNTSGPKVFEIAYDTGMGFFSDTTLNIPANNNFVEFQLSLPQYCWHNPGFAIRIAQTTSTYWGNFFIDNLLISGQYAEFSVDHILPASGPPGTQVQIHGSGFLNLVNLKYGSDSLFYQVVNDSLILLEIPAGATVSAPFTLLGSAAYQSPQEFNLILNSGNCYTGTGLFISELCEPDYSTQNYNKYIEIYNPTQDIIDLQGWAVIAYCNIGHLTADSFFWNLSGYIYPGQAMTCGANDPVLTAIVHDFAESGWIGAAGNVAFQWDGQHRDGVALRHNGSIVDKVIIDNPIDPYDEWFKNSVLVRNDSICAPSPQLDLTQWSRLQSPTSFNAGDPPSTPKSHTVTCQASPFTWNAYPENDSVCEGGEMVFGLALDGGGYAIDYQWYVHMPGDTAWTPLANGAGISGAQSDSLRIAQASLQWADAQFYCEAEAASISCGVTSRAVRAILLPTPSSSISNDTIVCAGSQVQLFASGGTAYLWSNGSSGDTVSVTPVNDGYYSVSVSNVFGCTSTDSVFVQVHPLPLISLSPDTSLCAGDSATLFASAPNAQSYLWSTQDSTQSIRVGSSPATYNLSVSDFNGCQADTSVSITQLQLPNVGFTFPLYMTFCIGDTVQIIGHNAQTYLWNGIYTGDTFLMVLASQMNIVNVIGTDSNGCSKSVTNQLPIVYSLPQLSLLITEDTLCEGETTIINISGASTYSWNQGLGNGSQKQLSPNTTTTYSVTGTSAQGCKEDTSFTITVHPLPQVSLAAIAPVCEDQSSLILSGGSPAGGTYSGSNVSGGIFNIAAAGPGTHSIAYTYLDPLTLCENSATESITVNELPQVSLASFAPVCEDQSSLILSGGSPAGGTYSGSNVSGGIFNIAAAGSGTHSITYTYLDPLTLCENSATESITVNDLPQLTLNLPPPFCIDDSVMLPQWVNPGGGTYSGTGISQGSFDPQLAGAGTHQIHYHYNDANSCSADTAFTVEVEMRYRIGGHLLYDADPARPMPNPSRVWVSSASPPYLDSSYVQNGAFRFSCLESGNYQLQAATDVAWGGSNASDALAAARYSVGLMSLSPLRRLAADVDMSGYVNAGDALYILNRFVGNISSFPRPDWILPSQTPLLQAQHLDSLVLGAICSGDVDGSHQPQGIKQEESYAMQHSLLPIEEKEGFTANFPRIWVSSPREWGAVSLRLRIDPPEAFGGLEALLPDAVWQYKDGELRFAAYSLEGQPCTQEYPLFFLRNASEMIRNVAVLSGTELADRAGGPLKEAVLLLGMPQSTVAGVQLWPNPARDAVHIRIKGWEEGEKVRWTLHQTSGQIVKEGLERKGIFMLPVAELVPGVYVISLDWGEGDATRTEHHRIVKTE